MDVKPSSLGSRGTASGTTSYARTHQVDTMQDAQIGWIAAIIIGGLAGWIASGLMKSDTGIFLNIVLGIIGAAIASFVFSFLGVGFGGWGRLSCGRHHRCLHSDLGRPSGRS